MLAHSTNSVAVKHDTGCKPVKWVYNTALHTYRVNHRQRICLLKMF
jgi:hypothetical protein